MPFRGGVILHAKAFKDTKQSRTHAMDHRLPALARGFWGPPTLVLQALKPKFMTFLNNGSMIVTSVISNNFCPYTQKQCKIYKGLVCQILKEILQEVECMGFIKGVFCRFA